MTYVTWISDEKVDPRFIATELQKNVSLVQNGVRMSGASLFFGDPLTLLSTALSFRQEISEADKDVIIWDGFKAALRSPKYDEQAILREVNKKAHSFFSTPRKKFVLVTSLSFRHFTDISRIETSGARIYVRKRLSKKYREPFKRAVARSSREFPGKYPDTGTQNRYSPTWVHIQGRSLSEATSLGSRALDLRRGIWNFIINRSKGVPSPSPMKGPVNAVRTGPLFSMHDVKGQLVSQTDWVNLDYSGPKGSKEIKRKWSDVEVNEKGIRKCLNRSPYSILLEDSLRRYCQALDSEDLSVSLVKLWSLLETLTGIEAQDGHDKVVKKVSFTFAESERSTHEHILHHLRRYRNAYVHRSEGSTEVGSYVHQLRIYVDHFLSFHLMNGHKLDSIEEVVEYLDISPRKSDIEKIINEESLTQKSSIRKQKLALKALSFHHGSP